ncbi:FlgD Ig-like domain-containing protein [Fibrobacter sp. UWOV1]|uniref:FlgD immunoglobulin-like domain containing protein n=1 Tax=Fibrobacter sp. UWOV1 TaxID=1896215 RepID=UPI0009144A86|nr:FlgD immunoglobulin-like domain containing protein [Fibrobacter sp. UWOV1]SHK44629.1 FlgD Ig-like domain-containing protein [Fibrobacter sp. UWOV1]
MKRVFSSVFLVCSCIWAQSGLTVEAFDEQSNNNTQLTLRLRLKNNTAETLNNIQAKYLIERDDSRTLNVYPYYMPNATYTLDTLSDYIVVNINVDAVASGFYPNESGISLGMVYSDGEDFYKDSDYSYPGKGNFKAAPNIVVMQNGAWLTGELPSSMAAAKLRFKAIQPENSDTRSAWVEIENYGKESVNLSRFVLKNSESHSASIGDFTLKHGEKLRVCQDVTLECPADDFSTVVQNLTFGNVGEIKLALGSKTVDYVAWGKQGTMGDSEPLPTIVPDVNGMYESYYVGAFFRYIDNIGWKIFRANEIESGDNSLPIARDYNMPDGIVVFLNANQKPRFSWVNVEGAESYILNVYSPEDKSLIYQKQTNLNYAEVDLPSGEYLWNVISVSDRYGMSVYEISFEDEKTLLRCIFKRDEESILQNMVYLNAPIFGARKDTRMLATNWGNKAAANRWNEIHKLTDPINEEEEWRCWAVAFNVLNKHYNGNLTQDEIKILGMKESLKNYYPFTKKNGEFAPLMYFPLGVLGGAGDEVIPVLYSEIFKMNDVKLNYLKSGVMPKHSVYKDVMKSDAENEINVTTFRKRLEAKRPILVITTNSNGSGHIMIIDGYATSGDDFCYSDDKSTCVVRKGDPVFHFINTDNNGSHYWASANSYRYKAYYVMEKPSFVLNRDPLLNNENNDADNDGVIAYDEVKRFKTDPDKWDHDEDGISDFNEIYAMVDRCTNLKVDLVDENGEKTGEKVEVGCTNFEYYDSDGDGEPTYRDPDSDNGGVKDGAEDLNGNGKLDPGETDPYLKSDDKKIEIVQKSYDLPDGITIFGRERVALNDGVVCYNSTKTDGDYCDIVSSSRDSKSTIILGVWAKVRNIYTRGGMWLRVKSVVDGFVAPYTLPSLKHPIKKDIDVTIRGKSDALNTVAFPYSDEFDTWTLDEEPKLEHVVKDGEVFEWKESDKYKTLKVEAGGKLVLNPGTFIAKELILDRKSAVEFTKPGEATQVVAMDFLNWRTEIINEDLPLVARGFKLITYMQSERLYTLGINWAGTLYAPKSYVVFGQASNKLMYGRFYADIAIVHQRTSVVRVDYDPIVPEVVPEEDEEEEEQEPVEGVGQEPVVAEDDQEPTDDDPSENEGDAFAKRHYGDDMVQESVVSPLAAELKGFSRNGIVFETKSAGIVKISVMSANGIMVKSFSAGNLEAGTHSVAWNSDNVPSGRYLVTLSQNGKVSGKFVSLK